MLETDLPEDANVVDRVVADLPEDVNVVDRVVAITKGYSKLFPRASSQLIKI